MKTETLRKFIALPLLLLFLLGGQTGAQAFVWCIGEDGHAALEYASSDACGIDPQQTTESDLGRTMLELPAGNEHCGPCLDIPPSLEINSGRLWDHHDSAVSADLSATALAPAFPPFSQILTTGLYPQPPPRISQAILIHRTIVLLN